MMMGGGSGIAIVVVIVAVCLFFLFLLPKGLTNMTSASIYEDGITFENPAPLSNVSIVGNCYNTKLQVDYSFKCALCNPKDITEYFWFKNLEDSEFTFLKGDRKIIHSGKTYTAERNVDVCNGNSYEWYMCIDDGKLKCAGKENLFSFKVY